MLTYKLIHDQDCQSPIDPEWTDLTWTVGYSSPRYSLGNKNFHNAATLEYEAMKAEREGGIVFPVYAYVHSGAALSLSNDGYPFNCPWDAGQSGFMWLTKEDIEKFGWKKTKGWKSRAKKDAEVVISEFNKWLAGDCWGYVIERDGEELDSCWGFIGRDYAESQAKDALDYYKQ